MQIVLTVTKFFFKSKQLFHEWLTTEAQPEKYAGGSL